MENNDKIVGLSSTEAEELLKKNGKNTLKEEKKKSAFEIFISQFINLTNLILGIAIVLSIVLKEYNEVWIMLFVVLLNGFIGFWEEWSTQKDLEALKKIATLKAIVIRDGQKKEISSEDVVVGDIVVLEAGKQVPADLQLLETANLKINESVLTGEAVPVEKDCNFVPKDDKTSTSIGDRLDRAYMSTIVTYGRGIGKVRKTGMETEIGKIADMVGQEKEKKSPIQKAMDDLTKLLSIGVVFVCIFVFVLSIIQGRDLMEMFKVAISLAVAAIPESIPTIVTIVLALGMKRLAKLNAIVKKLPAVETLGSVSYVCSDKTGTLTKNEMTVVSAYTNETFYYEETLNDLNTKQNELLINGFMLCCDASINQKGEKIGDPTEIALVALAKKFGKEKEKFEDTFPRINEKAFDSDRKLMTTVHTYNGELISFTKGSTDELLQRCTKILLNGQIREITTKDIENIQKAMKQFSNDALRVLSLAIRYNNQHATEQDLIYVGMVGMIDPERPEVLEAIRVFKEAGIKTIMITGDHVDTGLAIAKKLEIAENEVECIMGHELEELSDEELKERAKILTVFARVSPEHKVRIVKAFQNNGNIVSMTGDGVNDAPSLKAADVGVAMGITGTDVAKEAASMILQDDSFVTIKAAIKEGRNIYENLRKSIIFALSSNVSEIITMFVAIAMGLATPLKSIHILWVNLLTDSLPCIALGVDPNSSSNVMKKKPRPKNESLFANGGYFRIVIYSVLISLLTLGGFIYAPINNLLQNNVDITLRNIIQALNNESVLSIAQTYAFCLLATSELFHAIGMRDVETSLFKFKWLDNKMMIVAFVVGFVGQILVTEVPFLINMFGTIALSLSEWIVIILLSMTPMLLHEILILFSKKKNNNN